MGTAITVFSKFIFAFIGLFGVVWMAIAVYVTKRSRQSTAWLQGTATVLAADVTKSDTGPQGSIRVGYSVTYSPHVTYAYSVGGANYENDKYVFAVQDSIPTPEGAEAILRDYPVGGQVAVFYDPANPSDSTLVRGSSTGNRYFLLLGFVFIAIGIFGVFFWRGPGGH